MKVTKKDGTNERRIMIGMIVDTTVLGRIASRWTRESFRSKWCNLVGGWCVKFFAKYGQAPGNKIEGLYESWATDAKDKETLGLVESFLGGLSNEYETEKKTSNSQYLIDLAEKHFNENRVRQLHEALGGDLDTGDLDRAIARIDGFDQVRVADVVETDLFNDETALAEAFDDSETDSLISLPGDLGLFYGAELARDCLVSFMAPEKRGKTFMLLDLAFRAAVQRRRVAFFGVGDMTRKQMIRRFASRASACPIKSQKVKFPKKITREEDERYASVVIEEVDHKGLGLAGARKAFKKVVNHKIRSRHCYLKLLCVPNSTMSAADVIAKLRQWERVDGWSPDCVVVDYADILAPPTGVTDVRERIDVTWRELRSMTQQFHCLGVTATQSRADSYEAKTLEMKHFSNDKRKLAHVTAMIGINQTKAEKAVDVTRLNFILRREAENNPYRCLHAAGCRAIANPIVRSTF